MSKAEKRSKRNVAVADEEPEALPEIARHEEEEDKEASAQRGGKVSFQGSMTREEATAYFEAIAAGLRRGSLLFRRGEDELALSPAPHVEVQVKASGKEHKAKVSFELSWSTQGPSDLEIS
jgi:amphi-Trp domain-containing protein